MHCFCFPDFGKLSSYTTVMASDGAIISDAVSPQLKHSGLKYCNPQEPLAFWTRLMLRM